MNSKLQHKTTETMAKVNAAIAQSKSMGEVKLLSYLLEDLNRIKLEDQQVSVLNIKPSAN